MTTLASPLVSRADLANSSQRRPGLNTALAILPGCC
jgi:hypothetical protein